jgi:hypothetical protein
MKRGEDVLLVEIVELDEGILVKEKALADDAKSKGARMLSFILSNCVYRQNW